MSGKTVLVNIGKIKEIINASISKHMGDKLRPLLKNAQIQIQAIDRKPGCKCRRGPEKATIYMGLLSTLRGMTPEELQPLKAHLGADTLILGGGITV